ncbi:PIG-L family deacetylase [Litoreibacter sp.]|nr:PIG-L family deacetylase [Litoreibacter sp.]
MPLSDQTRIAQDRMTPRIVALWQALAPLKSVVSFMNTGAHPDDEISAMLAALGFRDGVDLSYACSTRGEGGQNDIGTERGAALGVLRTAEMECACAVLNMAMYWLSDHPEDSVFDFGFSKSGVETMGKWGRERTLARFVDIIRTERPDIICPTFLDVPGQHGHHRAMTQAAHLVMDLAADPTFDGSTLPIWQIKKLYLPAWSGAGQAYDDDLPPPPATLVIKADGVDPVTGFSYERIGQQSRAFHRTQAMGRWMATGTERNWPLHLAGSRVAGPDDSLFSGLARDLRDLGLAEAQDHIDAALVAFPDFDAVLLYASRALGVLQAADPAPEFAHKITRKRTQLDRVIAIAAGVQVHARLARDVLRPDDQTEMNIERRDGLADEVKVELAVPEGWSVTGDKVTLENAATSQPYPAIWRPHAPMRPCVVTSIKTHGVWSQRQTSLEVPPIVVPARSVAIEQQREMVNLATARRRIEVQLSAAMPVGAVPSLDVPDGWKVSRTDAGFSVELPEDATAGHYALPVTLDGEPAQTVEMIEHDHVTPSALARPVELQVLVVEAALPNAKIGYIGGGHDHVADWLARLGFDVTVIEDSALHTPNGLAAFDSIVIGIFAIRFHAGLAERMPALHDWVQRGGTLVTLYHRPWDSWDPDTTPPKRIEIGQPSLRWRVTDEAAHVTHLEDHAILFEPNAITAEDWGNWHKERGLYFAKDWDTAYTPLIAMSDPDEAPHRGALLVADIGKGRHVHCALILHHQMEHLVPGAFRLMANLLAKRD